MNVQIKKLKRLFNSVDHILTFGYIHYVHHTQNIITNVPMLIFYLCLQYYHLEEYFVNCSRGLSIGKYKSSVTCHANIGPRFCEVATCYQWLSKNQMAKWIINVNKCSNRMLIYLKENLRNETVFELYSDKLISINGCGTHTDEEVITWTTGDEIIIILDMCRGTLSLGINNEPLNIAIDNIWLDRKYKLEIGLVSIGDSVTLNRFISY